MAVLNEHKKIAYRVQKWLMTRPANIVDSTVLARHALWQRFFAKWERHFQFSNNGIFDVK